MGDTTLSELLLRLEALVRENEILRQGQQTPSVHGPVETAYYPAGIDLNNNSYTIYLIVNANDGQILEASQAALSFFGAAEEVVTQQKITDFEVSEKSVSKLGSLPINSLLQLRFRAARNEIKDVELCTFSLPALNDTPRIACLIFDVTEREYSNALLRQNEEMFRETIENTGSFIYRTDNHGYFVYANPAALLYFGYSKDELGSLHYTDFVRPDYQYSVHSFYLDQSLQRKTSTYLEFPLVTRAGLELWIGQSVQLVEEWGHLTGYQAIASDLTDRRRLDSYMSEHIAGLHRRVRRLKQRLDNLERANIDLEGMAMTDYLTGLRNYRAFRDKLGYGFQHARSTQTSLSLLLIDLDHFKQVNDRYGHSEGDRLLENLGALLLARARTTDTVARYGGEEFAVVLPFTDQNGAVAQAERLRALIEATFSEFHVTCSIGVSTLDGETLDARQLLGQADVGLYAAKQQRNSVRHYVQITPEMRENILSIVVRRPAAEGDGT